MVFGYAPCEHGTGTARAPLVRPLGLAGRDVGCANGRAKLSFPTTLRPRCFVPCSEHVQRHMRHLSFFGGSALRCFVA